MAKASKYDRFKADITDLSQFFDDAGKDVPRARSKRRRTRLHAPGVRFVKGTVPFPVLGQAWRLHRAAPLVLLAIKSEVDIQRWRTDEDNPEVAVTFALCAQLKLSRNARLRAVKALEAAGLISVVWTTRTAPRVQLVAGLFDEGKITVRSL